MPELTNSSVGSFAGTSGLEGTMVWPFERKYSRKLERMSLDFMEPTILPGGTEKPERLGPAMALAEAAARQGSPRRRRQRQRKDRPRRSTEILRMFPISAGSAGKKAPGRRGRPGQTPLLCVDAPVLQQPCSDRRHGALVRRRPLLQCAAAVEGPAHLTTLLPCPRRSPLRGRRAFPTFA